MYQSFSFNISPSNEHPGLISFRMDWLDVLAVLGTLKSLLQHSKASILWHSAFFTIQLSNLYMTTVKTIALTRRTFVVLKMVLINDLFCLKCNTNYSFKEQLKEIYFILVGYNYQETFHCFASKIYHQVLALCTQQQIFYSRQSSLKVHQCYMAEKQSCFCPYIQHEKFKYLIQKGGFQEAEIRYIEKCNFHFSISLAFQQIAAVSWCYIFHDIHSSAFPCYPLFICPLVAYFCFDWSPESCIGYFKVH